jgi:hypothetical protein
VPKPSLKLFGKRECGWRRCWRRCWGSRGLCFFGINLLIVDIHVIKAIDLFSERCMVRIVDGRAGGCALGTRHDTKGCLHIIDPLH